MVVIHHTAMTDAAAALARLCDPVSEVSAHYLIGADGRLWALVDEEARAWHAGAGGWGGRGDVNSASIGIELDNPGTAPFAAPQMAVLEALLADIMARRAIPATRVIGHACMAPDRKDDPGPRFDWRRLARAGLSVWPGPVMPARAPDWPAFRAAATAFGYPDAAPDKLLAAFRDRFRPRATGPLDGLDLALIRDLAARFPVDGTGRHP